MAVCKYIYYNKNGKTTKMSIEEYGKKNQENYTYTKYEFI